MKIEILFVKGARSGQRLELDQKETLRFGRRPENDIAFDANRDLDVSGLHAELRGEADGYFLYDVGSSNGTFVEGHRVTRLRVASGQEISFGQDGPRVRIRFTDDQATQASAGPLPPLVSVPPAAGSPSAAVPAGPAVSAPGPSVSGTGPAALSEPSATPAGGAASPSVGELAAASLGGDRRVGARTVAMMIDQAMKQAQERKGVSKSTVFLRSMVGQAVTRSTRRFKVVSIILVALLLGAVGGFLVLRHFERREAREEGARLRQEMAQLMAAQGGASSEEKTRLAQRLEEMNRKLASMGSGGSGKEIVRRNQRAVFLVAYEPSTGRASPASLPGGGDAPPAGSGAKGFCTAFAVGKRILATNAHCVIAYNTFRAQGHKLFLVMNRDPSQRFNIVKVAHHPDYHKPQRTISHDVGLLMVDREVEEVVQLAEEKELRELSAGDVMFTYGFPGRLASVSSPDATLVQGVIGRVTRLDGELGSFAENKLIQHSAFTSGGTSGSPVFTPEGKVIAVNTGGYVEPGSMQVMDPMTGGARSLVVAKQLAGYNFGIRIDVVRGLLDALGE